MMLGIARMDLKPCNNKIIGSDVRDYEAWLWYWDDLFLTLLLLLSARIHVLTFNTFCSFINVWRVISLTLPVGILSLDYFFSCTSYWLHVVVWCITVTVIFYFYWCAFVC